MAIVMGYWDCQYCNTKGVRGDKRECPNCGHPRDESVRFYMKETTALSQEEEAKVNKNPDWYCSFCNTLNSDNDIVCKSCSASREESEKNYFTLKGSQSGQSAGQPAFNWKSNVDDNNEETKQQREKERQALQASLAEAKRKRKKIFGIAIAAIVGLFILLCIPRKKTAEILDVDWERTIDIEQYANVDESDWSLPSDANLHETRQEIHHYNHVIDHYETNQVQRSRQVLDHYDTEYRDLGNGYFESYDVPVYTTEYYYETVEEPVYRDDPVYQTKYYYDIWKWIPERKVTTKAEDHNPYWGDPQLKSDERESNRSGEYRIYVKMKRKTKYYSLPEEEWNNYYPGDKLTIKVRGIGSDVIIGKNGNEITTY